MLRVTGADGKLLAEQARTKESVAGSSAGVLGMVDWERLRSAGVLLAGVDHVRNWCGGDPTPEGQWVSMAVPSDGSYGVPEGIISGFPVRTDGKGAYEIVQGVELSDGARAKLDRSVEELTEEREAVSDML